MKSIVFIENLRLHAYHGVLEQERVVGNDYAVTARIGYPIGKAMETDRVEDTINYAEISELIKREMAIPSALIEHVVGRIVNALQTTYPAISYIYIKVKKIAPPMSVDCDGAGVEVEVEAE